MKSSIVLSYSMNKLTYLELGLESRVRVSGRYERGRYSGWGEEGGECPAFFRAAL